MAAAAPSLVAPVPTAVEPDVAEGPPDGSPGGKKKLLALALVLALGGAGAFVFLRGADATEGTPAAVAAPVEGEVVEVAQMTVNLANLHNRYARISFAVVLSEGTVQDQVAPRFPLLQEAVLRGVTLFTPEDLRGPEGFDALSTALTEQAKTVYPEGEVLRVVLTELLVQ